MPKVFQRKRDKGKRRKFYWFNHVDATGKRRMIKGFTDEWHVVLRNFLRPRD